MKYLRKKFSTWRQRSARSFLLSLLILGFLFLPEVTFIVNEPAFDDGPRLSQSIGHLSFTLPGMLKPAEAVSFIGSAGNLIDMLRGMVRLARIVMMFVAALLGIICGVMWYTGQQQAQGMLQKFFVAVFFIFGATAILDAILGMTIGNVSVKTEVRKDAQGVDCNWAHNTGC